MTSPSRATALVLLGVIAAPFLVVRAASWLTGRGLATSQAAPQAVERLASVGIPSPPTPSDRQRRAMQWQDQVLLRPGLRSPFHRESAAGKPSAAPEIRIPDFVVSAIVAGERGSMASINRRLYRVGDPLDDQWRIILIDPDRFAVTIQHAGGTKVELFAR